MHPIRQFAALVFLTNTLITFGCVDARPIAIEADDGVPVRGGILKIVGGSDVDHLSTTSAYMTTSLWLLRTFARQLEAVLAITTQDLPVIIGITIVSSALIVLTNLAVDISYSVIDPRVRLR
jgi:ABC-type microcin C transport system permease subunit YejB